MKLNSSVVLTLLLLASMLGAGIVSGTVGASVGREALKGIQQPDTRPTSSLAKRQAKANSSNATTVNAGKKEEVQILSEEKILASVKERTGGNKDKKKALETESASDKADSKASAKKSLNLPVAAQSQGVNMEVTSSTAQGESLLLKVNLKNTGKQPVQFLYSFLDVKDDRGRTLSASADGLPEELPPNGEAFSGTITISTALLDKVEKLSLSLTDYPDQKLQLKLNDIPVVR
jgi:hypothetical protein